MTTRILESTLDVLSCCPGGHTYEATCLARDRASRDELLAEIGALRVRVSRLLQAGDDAVGKCRQRMCTAEWRSVCGDLAKLCGWDVT